MREYYEGFEINVSNLRAERTFLTKELSRSPDGRLMATIEDRYPRFFNTLAPDGSYMRRGITRDLELVDGLGHKDFVEEKLRRVCVDLALAEEMLRRSVSLDTDSILRALPKHFDLLNREYLISGRYAGYRWPNPSRAPGLQPLFPPLDTGDLTPEEWGALPYLENLAFWDNKVYYTTRGLACRSKSEAGILPIYDELGIPFHTDESMQVYGEPLAPDVIGARRDGKLIYHEHCGVNDEGYYRRNAHKADLYERAGIIQGRNLLLTFDHDDGSIDLELIKMQIKDIYRL